VACSADRVVLGRTGQRLLKAVHVASAGVWLGGLVAVVVILAAGPDRVAGRGRFGLDLAAYTIHETVLFWAFVVTLVTCFGFALFTAWGFFRHHWITAKWILAAGLFAITLWLQRPELGGVVGLSDAGHDAAGEHGYAGYRAAAVRLAAIQLAIVVVAFGLSTIKPWGARKVRPLAGARRRAVLIAVVVAGALGAGLGVWNHLRLRELRALPVADLDARGLAPGVYRGRHACGLAYAVDVTVAGDRITRVDAVAGVDSAYGRLATAMLDRVVASQSPAVDAITGATTSSRCLMKATEQALLAAGAEPVGR